MPASLSPARRQHALAPALVLALAALAPATAQAQDGDDWALRLGALTEAPLHVGADAVLEGPGRWRLRLVTGVLPASYIAASNTVVQAFAPGYDDSEAELVEVAISNALIMRLHGGWRPLEDRGLVVYAGLTWAGLGGGATGAELVEGLTGIDIDDNQAQGTLTVDATSTLWMADIAVGWEWGVWSDLTLYAGLGWSYTFQANADLKINPTPRTRAGQQAASALEQAGADYLVDLYTTYIHPPTVTLSASWSLL